VKLAGNQPYFFPYLGHFDLINQADVWIVYDVAQYIRHGWVNRNRILHSTSGWQYIIVPLKKHHFTTPINQIEISSDFDWRTKIVCQLHHYRKEAPYYSQTIDFLEECFSESERNLARCNTRILRATCHRLGIETPIQVFSEMGLSIGSVESPEDLAIGICLAVGAGEYINPPGGAGLYSAERFAERGIKLTIQSFTNMTYDCGRYHYEPALSIIDVMMWNSPEQIKHYLDSSHSNRTPEGSSNGE
jgi:hypothetical protein